MLIYYIHALTCSTPVAIVSTMSQRPTKYPELIHCRVRTGDTERFKRAAAIEGMDLSRWIRTKLIAGSEHTLRYVKEPIKGRTRWRSPDDTADILSTSRDHDTCSIPHVDIESKSRHSVKTVLTQRRNKEQG